MVNLFALVGIDGKWSDGIRGKDCLTSREDSRVGFYAQ